MIKLGLIYLLEMPGGGEMMVILFFFIIFFGAKKIPEIARGLGKGIREFKDASAGIKKELEEGIHAAEENHNPPPPPQNPPAKIEN